VKRRKNGVDRTKHAIRKSASCFAMRREANVQTPYKSKAFFVRLFSARFSSSHGFRLPAIKKLDVS